MSEDIIVDYEDYENLCPDCEDHNTCHKENIDYDRVYTCKTMLWAVMREAKKK